MASAALNQQSSITTLDALWTLFQAQTKSVREAFTQRLLDAEEAKRKAQEKKFKASFMRAMAEVKEEERTGAKLQTLDEFLSTLD